MAFAHLTRCVWFRRRGQTELMGFGWWHEVHQENSLAAKRWNSVVSHDKPVALEADLFYSEGLPFDWICHTALREQGFMYSVREWVTILRDPQAVVLAHNPTEPVPAL